MSNESGQNRVRCEFLSHLAAIKPLPPAPAVLPTADSGHAGSEKWLPVGQQIAAGAQQLADLRGVGAPRRRDLALKALWQPLAD